MRYILAIDGGATKTHCLIGDEFETVLGEYIGGPSNYHNVGKAAVKKAIENVVAITLRKSGLSLEQISLAYLGLSAADSQEDISILNELLAPVFSDVPIKVVNDCWIGLAQGTPDGWGAVSISGTGANAAARTPEGVEVILRSLSYPLGNFGGGADMAVDALHHAFRSEEGTGPKTVLEDLIPDALGVKKLADLVGPVFSGRKEPGDFSVVPPLVFKLANEGDEVCQSILIEFGTVAGQMVAGVIKRAGMTNHKVPVVLTGGLYKGENPLLIDALTLELHRRIPSAYLIKPNVPPVIGALREAIRCLGK